ncbi:lasso peptide biosynthesis B2 protein [Phenylobacterium sp.]|jgi:hypothetical protein|uniref:lasso peptide biosynthesis B2 protein n=1 Tax=Phenylobacterium sp. TaxID=1871053 RepID=UPI002E33A5A4|nr:lasso peptide biosynthesis B2 protein [Phenylobacterium sp.]HEX2558938.1 lasso peptide biosynthesis B2 protein [Phenylobacterium sp.]
MRLAFPAHVHAAVVGEDLVLLDTAADAYFCVPGGAARLRPDANLSGLDPDEPEAALRLRAAGLVLSGPARRATAPPPDLPRRGLPVEPGWSLTTREAGRLAGAVSDLPRRYACRPLRRILSSVEAARGRGTPVAAASEALRLASLFQAAAIWLPMPRKCLVRSFVLLRFLQRSGCRATWVFGVKTWPFGAHCWLQLDDFALDDAPERLAAYTPILAVEG